MLYVCVCSENHKLIIPTAKPTYPIPTVHICVGFTVGGGVITLRVYPLLLITNRVYHYIGYKVDYLIRIMGIHNKVYIECCERNWRGKLKKTRV